MISAQTGLFEKKKWWMRLNVCINVHIKPALLNVLHNHVGDPLITGLPCDPHQLCTFLLKNKNKFEKRLKNDQRAALLPSHGTTVDASQFDVTLIRFLIQTFSGIKNAKGNWKEPDGSDTTIAAYVFRAACIRNEIFHSGNIQISEDVFDDFLKRIETILAGLNYVEDIKPIKTDHLDDVRVQEVMTAGIIDFFIFCNNRYSGNIFDESDQKFY